MAFMIPPPSKLRQRELIARVADPCRQPLLEPAPLDGKPGVQRQVRLLVRVFVQVVQQPGVLFERDILPAIAVTTPRQGRSTLSLCPVGITHWR